MTTVTLTVVYDSSGTWDFSSTDSSVTGVSGTAITVTDGTNYYYYAPATDTLGTSLSGGTWQTVYELGSNGYIQSSGTQYINTGYNPASVSYFGIDFSMTPTSLKSEGNYFYGTEVAWCSFEYTSSSGAYWNTGSTTFIGEHSMSVDNTYTYSITYSNNVFTSTGSYSVTRSFSGTLGSGDFCFFNNGGSSNYSSEKLYYLKLYSDSTTLVRDYIPILYGSTYALYDKCLSGDVIYDNDGSGSFTGGGTQSALTYTHTVQGSPSVKVFNATSDTWVDGTPYVFNGTSWVEADAVYVYVNGSWVEKT